VIPVLLLLVLMVFQVALWWHAKQVADAAAREAVEAAQVADGTRADAEAAAWTFLRRAGNLAAPAVAVERGAAAVAVEVTGSAPRLVPGPWQVTARAVGDVERFIAEPER
jgi:hypothetical protein